ncbi:hypothetical protein [Verticiella sediminum]|nr:hypothetical protein [Verticiella sediminum]
MEPIYDTATGKFLLIPYMLEVLMAGDRGFRKTKVAKATAKAAEDN